MPHSASCRSITARPLSARADAGPLEPERLEEDLGDLILRWLLERWQNLAQRRRLEHEQRVELRCRVARRSRVEPALDRERLIGERFPERVQIREAGITIGDVDGRRVAGVDLPGDRDEAARAVHRRRRRPQSRRQAASCRQPHASSPGRARGRHERAHRRVSDVRTHGASTRAHLRAVRRAA